MTHANPRPTWNDFAPNYGPYLPLNDEQKSYDGIPSGILPSGEEGLLDSRQDRGENLGFGINYPYPYPNLATEAKFAQVYGQSPIVFDKDYWEDSGVLQTLPPNPGTPNTYSVFAKLGSDSQFSNGNVAEQIQIGDFTIFGNYIHHQRFPVNKEDPSTGKALFIPYVSDYKVSVQNLPYGEVKGSLSNPKDNF